MLQKFAARHLALQFFNVLQTTLKSVKSALLACRVVLLSFLHSFKLSNDFIRRGLMAYSTLAPALTALPALRHDTFKRCHRDLQRLFRV